MWVWGQGSCFSSLSNKTLIMKEIIDIQPLWRMRELLKKALNKIEEEKLDELGEMGAIQAFEVSYELV